MRDKLAHALSWVLGYYLGTSIASGLVSDIDASYRLVDSGSFFLPLVEAYCADVHCR